MDQSIDNPLLSIFLDGTETVGDISTEKEESSKSSTTKSTTFSRDQRDNKAININDEHVCKLCDTKFTYRNFKEHKKTDIHKQARKLASKLARDKSKQEQKKKKKEKSKQQAASVTVEKDRANDQNYLPAFAKQKYYLRLGTDILEPQQFYQNTLTAFLALRCAFSSDNKDIKISVNDSAWKEFGDIVIEITNLDVTEIYAIQCKQWQNRNNISISTLSAEKGKFSIRKQCEILSGLREKKNYDKTYFILYTISNLLMDNNPKLVYDENVLKEWNNKDNKKIWENREAIIAPRKKKCLINSTDDPANMCIFVIENGKDSDLKKDLSKFSLYINQKKITGLRLLIKSAIEEKFENSKDITNDLIKYIGVYFKTDKIHKCNYSTCAHYKLSKRDINLKIAELILAPYMLFPETSVEEKSVESWNSTIEKFDIVITKNNYDILNKMYSSINFVLKSKLGCLIDTSLKSLKIRKSMIADDAIKSQIFDGFDGDNRDVSLPDLYKTLWKTGLAPLVLTVENENHLSLIIKIINFLKNENISLKFILTTNMKIHPSDFPEHLKLFINLEDLKVEDETFLGQILDEITIPFLDFNVTLRDIVKSNTDFLAKLTPCTLLNMFLKDYSFKDTIVPMTDEIIENTVVFDEVITKKIKNYLRRNEHIRETNNLTYVINVRGNPTFIEVPPNI